MPRRWTLTAEHSIRVQSQKIASWILDGNHLFQFRSSGSLNWEDGNICLLQKIPVYNHDQILDTTCMLMECPNPNKIFLQDSFRVSFEKPEQRDPETNSLGYEAAYSLFEACRSSRHPDLSKRGIGAAGERWICLSCLEMITKEADEVLFPGPDFPELPWHSIRSLAEFILADVRSIPAFPGRFTLSSPYHFGLEKWKAVHRYIDKNRPEDLEVPSCVKVPGKLILGEDGKSLYLDDKARNMRGLTEDGVIAEITAEDCIGATLNESLQKVQDIVGAIRISKRQTRQAKDAMGKLDLDHEYQSTPMSADNLPPHARSTVLTPGHRPQKLKFRPKTTSRLCGRNRRDATTTESVFQTPVITSNPRRGSKKRKVELIAALRLFGRIRQSAPAQRALEKSLGRTL